MQQSLWTRVKRRMRRALARARRVCTRFEKAAPPRVYQPWSPSDKDFHVLGCKFLNTEENVTPDFEFCDLAMTTAAGSSRNWHRNHTYLLKWDPARRPGNIRVKDHADSFIDPVIVDAAQVLREKTKFCAFVFENYMCTTRNRFLEILSAHMRVDSGGRTLRSVRHSLGQRYVPNLAETVGHFYRPYKFVLAFENTLSLHYASEKLGTALHAHTVPVYWGNPQIVSYFNPERFINAFDFDSLESLARHVMRVHEDDALYLRYLSVPARTLRQDLEKFPTDIIYKEFFDLKTDFCSERKTLLSFYQGLTEKRRKGFLEQYMRLMTGRTLPLAQRRMFHRECLSRFAPKVCGRILEERLTMAGWGFTRVLRASRWHVWPHRAFYKVVDMDGRLRAKD